VILGESERTGLGAIGEKGQSPRRISTHNNLGRWKAGGRVNEGAVSGAKRNRATSTPPLLSTEFGQSKSKDVYHAGRKNSKKREGPTELGRWNLSHKGKELT